MLKEAQRAETYLNLFEYPIDAVVINRVLPQSEPAMRTWTHCWHASNARWLTYAKLSPAPTLRGSSNSG